MVSWLTMKKAKLQELPQARHLHRTGMATTEREVGAVHQMIE